MSDAPSQESPAIERLSYEVLRDRLLAHGRSLGEKASALNQRRLERFGSTTMSVVGSERIRTENNCVPRDLVAVGSKLLFGYNVFLGLRRETAVADVLSLHVQEDGPDGVSFSAVPPGSPGDFLADPRFVANFRELYEYYKLARLLQLRVIAGKLLAVFQTGERLDDVKVLRWSVAPDGAVTYIDNRGERDHVYPPSHDFEWTAATRDDYVVGTHPHVSILDEVFVETVAGDLTIKIESNTEDGLGIFREPVDDPDQTLDDAQIRWAKLGVLILIDVLPYRETKHRYLVYNSRTRRVVRLDAIGNACVQLPEDQGIIYPGGYCLRTGEVKTFDAVVDGMELLSAVRSPNGEDVLYAFHRRDEGRTLLLPYNLIRKEISTPLVCHGFSLASDGRMVLFRATGEEPTRVHLMQVWQTPFFTAEFHDRRPRVSGFLDKIGNAELVRGISDLFGVKRLLEEQEPTRAKYEDLVAAATRVRDAYHWLEAGEAGDARTTLAEVREAAERAIDEFAKVEALRAEAVAAVETAQSELAALVRTIRPDVWRTLDPFVAALASLRTQRGHLVSLRERRYVDLERIGAIEKEAVERFDHLSRKAVEFLAGADALSGYHARIDGIGARLGDVRKVAETKPLIEALDKVGAELDVLMEVVSALRIDDATARTAILEAVSRTMAGLNGTRALLQRRRLELVKSESEAGFSAELTLLGQAVTGALAVAVTPEKCDQELSRLMVALEDIEGRFGELPEYTALLAIKREEIYEALSAKKQILLDQRQRRAGALIDAAERILQGVTRRAHGLAGADALNAYFAADPMIAKLRDIATGLRAEGDPLHADELEGRLKTARTEAARSLRDRKDLYEEGATVIRLGRHRFTVNSQPLELTVVPRDGGLSFHLTGTSYFAPARDPALAETRALWDQTLVSETDLVYRAEYLAYGLLADAENGTDGASIAALQEAALDPEALLGLVRARATSRYDEGYERGVHDHDAALILGRLLALHQTAGLLRFPPSARSLAVLYWTHAEPASRQPIELRARSLARLRETFAGTSALADLAAELSVAIERFALENALPMAADHARSAGLYLVEELAREPVSFVLSAAAEELRRAFVAELEAAGGGVRALSIELESLGPNLAHRHALATAWLQGLLDRAKVPMGLGHVRDEAVTLLLCDRVPRESSSASVESAIVGLLGQHPRLADGGLELRLDEFLSRLGGFVAARVRAFRSFQELRARLLEEERKTLRLGEYQAKVMSAFVRNKLIDEVYLPLIGDNLAKQIGALGDARRTDLMGLLLLISPPGYGKTTLMEYVANRLGLVFVKVNGPALGPEVTSLDPAEAPNATARQEIAKIGLALEMGNNVLLYLDDIQHTSPELLQKFISLCDAQRKIEGVWRGETKTYDLRGKRFAVCMAGNPYTESGARFSIPDMLANRADIYNLGDVLAGKESLFALSYLENALTSSPTLKPLTTRDSSDVAIFVRMAEGDELAKDQLSHPYSEIECAEIVAVLKHLIEVQKLLLRVNRLYIDSASQQDAYRSEPPFRLQGSYRNMNKIAERVVPAMTRDELERLLDDHYRGEAQTLTTGAEENLLKLAEIRGRMTPEEERRWAEVKKGFQRVQATGGDGQDPVSRITGEIGLMSRELQGIGAALTVGAGGRGSDLSPYLERLDRVLTGLADGSPRGETRELMLKQAELVDATLLPLLRSMATQLKGVKDLNDSRLRRLLPRLEYLETLGDLFAALDEVDDSTAPEPGPKRSKPPKR